MKATIVFLFFITFSASAVQTDLRPGGAEEVVRLFNAYRGSSPGCNTSFPGRRVLLTGFGLFQNVTFNSAGGVVANIANPAVWPASVNSNEKVAISPNAQLESGIFLTTMGGQIFSRPLSIDGEQINLCVIVMDVLWDIAGAIVAFEMDRFQPQTVLMLGGGGGAILEGGAFNSGGYYEGYYANGNPSLTNVPVGLEMLPGLPRELNMTWNNRDLERSVSPYLRAENIELATAPGARKDNNYLCNHVSYVALAAARSDRLVLANGQLILQPRVLSNPQVGFFHLPWNLQLNRATIETWGSLVTSIIHYMGR